MPRPSKRLPRRAEDSGGTVALRNKEKSAIELALHVINPSAQPDTTASASNESELSSSDREAIDALESAKKQYADGYVSKAKEIVELNFIKQNQQSKLNLKRSIWINLLNWSMELDDYKNIDLYLSKLKASSENNEWKYALYVLFYQALIHTRCFRFDSAAVVLEEFKKKINKISSVHNEIKNFFLALREFIAAEALLAKKELGEATKKYQRAIDILTKLIQEEHTAVIDQYFTGALNELPITFRNPRELLFQCTLQKSVALQLTEKVDCLESSEETLLNSVFYHSNIFMTIHCYESKSISSTGYVIFKDSKDRWGMKHDNMELDNEELNELLETFSSKKRLKDFDKNDINKIKRFILLHTIKNHPNVLKSGNMTFNYVKILLQLGTLYLHTTKNITAISLLNVAYEASQTMKLGGPITKAQVAYIAGFAEEESGHLETALERYKLAEKIISNAFSSLSDNVSTALEATIVTAKNRVLIDMQRYLEVMPDQKFERMCALTVDARPYPAIVAMGQLEFGHFLASQSKYVESWKLYDKALAILIDKTRNKTVSYLANAYSYRGMTRLNNNECAQAIVEFRAALCCLNSENNMEFIAGIKILALWALASAQLIKKIRGDMFTVEGSPEELATIQKAIRAHVDILVDYIDTFISLYLEIDDVRTLDLLIILLNIHCLLVDQEAKRYYLERIEYSEPAMTNGYYAAYVKFLKAEMEISNGGEPDYAVVIDNLSDCYQYFEKHYFLKDSYPFESIDIIALIREQLPEASIPDDKAVEYRKLLVKANAVYYKQQRLNILPKEERLDNDELLKKIMAPVKLDDKMERRLNIKTIREEQATTCWGRFSIFSSCTKSTAESYEFHESYSDYEYYAITPDRIMPWPGRLPVLDTHGFRYSELEQHKEKESVPVLSNASVSSPSTLFTLGRKNTKFNQVSAAVTEKMGTVPKQDSFAKKISSSNAAHPRVTEVTMEGEDAYILEKHHSRGHLNFSPIPEEKSDSMQKSASKSPIPAFASIFQPLPKQIGTRNVSTANLKKQDHPINFDK